MKNLSSVKWSLSKPKPVPRIIYRLCTIDQVAKTYPRQVGEKIAQLSAYFTLEHHWTYGHDAIPVTRMERNNMMNVVNENVLSIRSSVTTVTEENSFK